MYGRPAAMAAAMAALLLGFGSAFPTAPADALPASAPPGPATVLNAVDGATVNVSTAGGQNYLVHALGIDAPTTRPAACWSVESTQFARATLVGKQVQLTTDATQSDTDEWQRALRYIVLPDGQNYSILAAAKGAARSTTPTTTADQRHADIVAAEEHARSARLGLWGPECAGRPANPATAPPGPVVIVGAPEGIEISEGGVSLDAWLNALKAGCNKAHAGPKCVNVDLTYTGDDHTDSRSKCTADISSSPPGTTTNASGHLTVPPHSTIGIEANCTIEPAPDNANTENNTDNNRGGDTSSDTRSPDPTTQATTPP